METTKVDRKQINFKRPKVEYSKPDEKKVATRLRRARLEGEKLMRSIDREDPLQEEYYD